MEYALSADSKPYQLHFHEDRSELLNDTNDVVIAYGDGNFKNWKNLKLFDEILVPVTDKAYSEEDLKKLPLLDYPLLAPDWIGWRKWLSSNQDSMLQENVISSSTSYAHSIGKALAGEGIALASLGMFQRALDSGKLFKVGMETYRTGRGYYLLLNSNSIQNNSGSFVDFLLTQLPES